MIDTIKRNPSMAQYDVHNFHNKTNVKFKHLVPKDKREANKTIVKNDKPSPQSYDLLTGKGLVDTKNIKL